MIKLFQNPHFVPQSAVCPWCLGEFFDAVGTLEEFDKDAEFIAGLLNATVSKMNMTVGELGF